MPRFVTVLLALALALGLTGVARAQNPAPPTVTTGTPSDVGTTTAKVAGRVDSSGVAATYHFEYGTSTSYGLSTPDQALALDAGATDVSAQLTELTSATTYHVRLVATNAAGTARGTDKTLRTLSAATRPSVSTATASEIGLDGATLAVRVNPQALDTTYAFDYGTSSRYGSSTAAGSLPASRSSSAVSARIGALTANTTYHFRVRATNSAGTTTGTDRTFRTAKVPTGLSFSAPPSVVEYRQAFTLTGVATGSDRAGLTVLLERRPFPFSGDFIPVASAKTSSSGTVRFALPSFTTATEYRLNAAGNVSSTQVVGLRALVRVNVRRPSRGTVRFSGHVGPGALTGRVSLQRQSASGRFVPVKRTELEPGGTVSDYSVTVPARRRATTYRVATILTGDAGVADGRSPTFLVPGRRR